MVNVHLATFESYSNRALKKFEEKKKLEATSKLVLEMHPYMTGLKGCFSSKMPFYIKANILDFLTFK